MRLPALLDLAVAALCWLLLPFPQPRAASGAQGPARAPARVPERGRSQRRGHDGQAATTMRVRLMEEVAGSGPTKSMGVETGEVRREIQGSCAQNPGDYERRAAGHRVRRVALPPEPPRASSRPTRPPAAGEAEG